MLTWNLFHGRTRPGRNEDQRDAFATALAAWSWDVALLQEVPPWWPRALARVCDAESRHALTSRNALLPLRRALARRWPELMKANGGGCNAILVRGPDVTAHEVALVRAWPERRVVHAVRDPNGRWFANVHASTGRGARTHGDVARARTAALRWAGDAPIVLGGDLNVEQPVVPDFAHVGGNAVDHVFARGLRAGGPVELLDAGALSDHKPVRVTLAR